MYTNKEYYIYISIDCYVEVIDKQLKWDIFTSRRFTKKHM